MMYKHKNLKQLLCCVLLLCLFCGSSLGFYSVKAATVPDNSPSIFASTYLGNNGTSLYTTYSVTSLQPYIFSYSETLEEDQEHNSWKRFYRNIVIKQDYVVSFTVQNTSGDGNVLLQSAWIGAQLNTPAYQPIAGDTSNSQFVYTSKGFETSNYHGDLVGIRTTGGDTATDKMHFLLNEDFYNGGYILLPEGYKIHCSFVITAVYNINYNWYTSKTAPANTTPHVINQNFINGFDCPASSLAFDTYNVELNSQRESHLPAYSLDNIENNTSAIHDQLVSVLSNQQSILNAINLQKAQDITNTENITQQITDNDEVTQGLISDQTQQQQDNYDAFSANTDTSDSNNINSAITGGTDAVKQKMGLFSFFDGIVSDLSDVLTKNHERHLVLPALDVPLPEETVHIWDRKEFDFEELENNFGAIITVVRFATVAVCYVTMINGAYHLFHKFIGVKDSDA